MYWNTRNPWPVTARQMAPWSFSMVEQKLSKISWQLFCPLHVASALCLTLSLYENATDALVAAVGEPQQNALGNWIGIGHVKYLLWNNGVFYADSADLITEKASTRRYWPIA